MNMKKLRLLTVLVAAALVLAIMAGCQPNVTTTAPTTGSTAETTTASTEINLPLTTEDVTFTAFMPINRTEQDYNNNEIWKEITKRTGIKFEFECPTADVANERLSLILASQQLPDLIFTSTGGSGAKYPGGNEVAVDSGDFLDLKPLLAENAPIYWDYLTKNESAMFDSLTDKGYIAAINEIVQKDTDLNVGIWCNVTRGDWLKDLNLEVPTTIDEWHTALTGFKDTEGAVFPLLWMLGNNPIWSQAYGINCSPFTTGGSGGYQQFYPDANGKIHYGGIEQGYEDYLVTLSQWYAEGLFDRDFATRGVFDLETAAPLFGTGKAGVQGGFLAWTGWYMGVNAGADPDFEIAVCPAPVLNKGEKSTAISYKAEYLGFNAMSVTTQCKNPELFLQLINYLSSPEGQLLTNYGIEGTHYTMVDGKPTFTDLILKNENGASDAREVIIGNFNPINLVGTTAMMSQLYDPNILASAKIPTDSTNVLYAYYQLNEDEANQLSEIFGDINTYVAEEYTKAVMSPTVAAAWMETQAVQLKTMGIEEAIAICQGAYDRYLAKK